MNEMDEKERLIKLEEMTKAILDRLIKTEEEIKNQRELVSSVKEIATEVKHMREEMGDINMRLKVVEKKPVENWDYIFKTTLGYIATAILAFLFAKLLK